MLEYKPMKYEDKIYKHSVDTLITYIDVLILYKEGRNEEAYSWLEYFIVSTKYFFKEMYCEKVFVASETPKMYKLCKKIVKDADALYELKSKENGAK